MRWYLWRLRVWVSVSGYLVNIVIYIVYESKSRIGANELHRRQAGKY